MEQMSSKCKNCGSELWYNPKSGSLTCKYCESNYFLPTKKDDAVIVRQYSPSFHPNQLCKFLTAYKCNACSSVYYMSSEEKSKKCPNCGGSSVSLVEDAGYSADGIIPFKITKEEASKKFSQYLKSQRNIPKSLRKLAENQKLMGVFVPVWNFSYNIHADYSATVTELKKDYYGSYYGVPKPIFGEKVKRVKSLDENATTSQDDTLLELFDENDYAELIPFIPEYTYGYRVDSVDKDIHDYYYAITSSAEKEMEESIRKSLLSKYKEISDIQINAVASDVFFNFAYVPVYVNNFEYKGKVHKTYISGTTGKVVGKPPKSISSKIKKSLKVLLLAAIVGAIAYLFLR
jgi:DNA-directed RNA polymerase subunit RPC12/RpoP